MLIMSEGKVIVEPVGPKDAKLILVGEAPGALEEVSGKPFMGPAGTVLNQILAAAGVNRRECYITNVIKERPPKTKKKTNDISTFIDFTKKGVIETEEYKAYVQRLKGELENVSAKVIVAFGNVALYALTGIFPPMITKRRGSIYPCTLVPGKKVIASIHPAATIQRGRVQKGETGGMWLWRHFIRYDLERAVAEINRDGLPELDWDVQVNPSFFECMSFLKMIERGDTVGFDIEVINLEVSHISFAIVKEKKMAISIPFIKNGVDYMVARQELEIWREIGRILSDENIKKVGQNLIFDTQFIFRKYGIVTKNMDDTMVAQGTLFPDFPKGLDFITSIYTDIPYYKDEGKKHFKLSIADDAFSLYNAKDSIVCIEAIPRQRTELIKLGSYERYKYQTRLIPALTYMSERGIKVDVENMRKASAKAAERINELSEMLNTICGYEINYNSPKQLMEYFYGKLGHKPYMKRGVETTDVDALKRLAAKGIREASILLEIRRIHKLKSTYLDANLDDDNRLRCAFNPVGAADSGRLSSSKTIWGTGMNTQNMPPEFKKFLLFDDGYVGYDIDLSQAENRVVAYIAPDFEMIGAFENGIDIHSKTASGIFGKPIEKITKEIGTCPICKNPETCGHKGERFWGKKANHSFNYGLGPFQFAYKMGIPNVEGRRIRDGYHNTYPGIRQYWMWIQEELKRSRTLVNLYGTHRIFMGRWGDQLFKEAYSWIPQSTVADKINREGVLEVYENQMTYRPIELLNQVHDSIVIQIPLSIGWRQHAILLTHIKESLERPLKWRGREFIIPAGLSMGKCFYGMKDVDWRNSIEELAIELQTNWSEISKDE